MGGFLDGIASTLDHAAGSTDESIARTFDDESGGGVFDPDTYVSAGEDVLDVPADAWNATTGTGEDLGWFGELDRALDPRSWDGEEPDWAEPSEETDGISGFFAGATGATGEIVNEAAEGAMGPLLRNPALLFLVLLVVLYVFGQAFDVQVGGDA